MFESEIDKVALQLSTARQAGILEEFVLIGGLAVAVYSRSRATDDIDFAVSLSDEQCSALSSCLKLPYFAGDADDPLIGVFRAETSPAQCIRFPDRFNRSLFLDPLEVRFNGQTVPVCGWRGLIILKLYAGSPLDLEDISSILRCVCPNPPELQALGREAEDLGLDTSVLKLTGRPS